MTPFLVNFAQSFQSLRNLFRKSKIPWGRYTQRDYWSNAQPSQNPDPVDRESQGERYHRASLNPYIKAGLNQRDCSRFFVSAKGLEPNESGSYFPPQLIYTSPENANQEQFDTLAFQYDEGFQGGFSPIIRSLHQPALVYGRAIGEIMWERDGSRIVAPTIESRDPAEFSLNPANHPPGIYLKTGRTGDGLKRMKDTRFMLVTYDPLFGNPYGTAALKALIEMAETWHDVYDARRMAMIKAGYGSWLGSYGSEIAGNDLESQNLRDQFLEQVKLIANGTASIYDDRNNIRAEKLQFEAKAFLDFDTSFIQAVSVVLTGSPTTLSEGKYGSKAREESTSVRQKSQLEISDALLMGLAFTYQFNQWFLRFNFANVEVVPQLQLIQPELIQPTTPEGQDTADEHKEDEGAVNIRTTPQDEESAEMQAFMFQEEDEKKKPGDIATPTLGGDDPEPDIYFQVEKAAREYLDKMPVKNYRDVTPEEAPQVFCMKRLNSYPDAVALQKLMLAEITKTIGAKTEKEAWAQYWPAVVRIFKARGADVRAQEDFLISFQQARQRAYQVGINELIGKNKGDLYGIRIQTRDDPRVRGSHNVWDDIVLKPDDPRLEKLQCPMDFGCRCNQLPVMEEEKEQWPLTPEARIPIIFPGESYRNYVTKRPNV